MNNLQQLLMKKVHKELTGSLTEKITSSHLQQLENTLGRYKLPDIFPLQLPSQNTMKRHFGILGEKQPNDLRPYYCNMYAYYLGYEDYAQFVEECESELEQDHEAEQDLPTADDHAIIRYDLPSRPNYFVGREAHLTEIDNRLKSADGRQLICLVSGVGGMGKTTLVQEYIHDKPCQNHFARIIYLSIRDHEDIQEKLISAGAYALGIDLREFPNPDDLAFKVVHELKQCKGHNLIYIDNANDKDQLVNYKHWLEDLGWRIIITTRSRPASYTHEMMDIEELSLEQAKTLFKFHYMTTGVDDENTLTAMLLHIHKHTLLVELLAKIGRIKGLQVLPLFEILEQDNKRLMKALEHDAIDEEVDTGISGKSRGVLSEATLHHFILNLFEPEKLNEEHIEMVRFFSVLPPEDISMKHLITLWQVDETAKPTFEKQLNYIDQWGWVKHNHYQSDDRYEQTISYKMHHLVQEVVYEKLPPNIDNVRPLVRSITDILREPLNFSFHYQEYAKVVLAKLNFLH